MSWVLGYLCPKAGLERQGLCQGRFRGQPAPCMLLAALCIGLVAASPTIFRRGLPREHQVPSQRPQAFWGHSHSWVLFPGSPHSVVPALGAPSVGAGTLGSHPQVSDFLPEQLLARGRKECLSNTHVLAEVLQRKRTRRGCMCISVSV